MNYLGKVAKGVGGVLKAVEGVAVARDDSVANEVEALVHRISDSSLPEDKLQAVGELRDLVQDNPKAQLAMGAKGLSVMVDAIMKESDNLEMLRGVLEILLVSFTATDHTENQGKQEASAAAINSELFTQKRDNIAVILSLLQEEPVGIDDFYVRYHALQLLTCLMQTSIYKLEEAILQNTMGVVRLMDMLKEREAIRNEVLLLLASLTKRNEEIQKIAAFEGAFDRLLGIIKEDGGSDGSIVVLDCLEVVNNLLRSNMANQRLFREMGVVGKLVDFLTLTEPDNLDPDALMTGTHSLPQEKAANLKAGLDSLALLVAPPHNAGDPSLFENYSENQSKCFLAGCLPCLAKLALEDGGVSDVTVRSLAMRCMGYIILGRPEHHSHMAKMTVPVNGQSMGALQLILTITLSSLDTDECGAADYLLQCFFWNNSQAQVQYGSTLSAGFPHPSFGHELIQSLAKCTEGSPVGCRAARILRYILEGSLENKARMLQIGIEVPMDTRQEYLLNWCVELLSYSLQHGSNWVISACLIRLLICWVDVCPMAVQALLEPQHQMSLIVGVLNNGLGPQDPAVVGLTAMLLGVCLVACQRPGVDSGGMAREPMRDYIMGLITNSVGTPQTFYAIDALTASPSFLEIANSQTPIQATDANPFDPQFVHFVHQTVPEIQSYMSDTQQHQPHPTTNPNINANINANANLNATQTPGQSQTPPSQSPEPVRPHSSSAQYSERSGGGTPQPVLNAEHLGGQDGVGGVHHPDAGMGGMGPPQTGVEFEFGGNGYDYANQQQIGVQSGQDVVGEGLPVSSSVPLEMSPAPETPPVGHNVAMQNVDQDFVQALQREVAQLREDNSRLQQELAHARAVVEQGESSTSVALESAEMRASQAEWEVGKLKRDIENFTVKFRETEEQAFRMQQDAQQAVFQSEKSQQQYLEMSESYAALQLHSQTLEERVRDLETTLSSGSHMNTTIPNGDSSTPNGSTSTGEAMGDLLLCLGLEHEKVNRLSRRLELLGEDVGRILDGVNHPDGLIFGGRNEDDLT